LAIHPEKTKITHINKGFEFLGYKLKRGKGLKLAKNKIGKKMNSSNIYALPKEEIWSHRYKRWRNYGWKYYNERRLYGEFKLVSLLTLIPDLRLKTVSI
jgi:hypothetical protein